MGVSGSSIANRCQDAYTADAAFEGEETETIDGGGGEPFSEQSALESLSPKARDVVWLIELYRENERLLARQRGLREQIGELMEYWHREGANRDLAWARLVQLRVKHQGVLAHLKANRAMSIEILDRNGDGRDDRVAS